MTDSYLEWINRHKEEHQTRSLDYYLGFLEGARYDIGALFEAFDDETLAPFSNDIMKFYNERLDEYEKYETNEIHCGYDYFIWLLKKNNLDLDETTDQEPYIYYKYKGLIDRTSRRLRKKAGIESESEESD